MYTPSAYYNEISNLIKAGKLDYLPNEDRRNNADITLKMLEEGGHVKMYCGEMSVFRNAFYEKIAKGTDAIKAEDYRMRMTEVLTEFFSNKENRLDIVLAKKATFADLDGLLCEDILKEALEGGQLTISVADPRLVMVNTMSHFMFSEKHRMARIERDPSAHSALFFVYMQPATFKSLRNSFDVIRASSEPIAC